MDALRLRYFCDVAQTEHMTRSAQRLNVAQPALTRAIHQLERELGVALFEHVGRNIRLTPEGAYLREQVAPLLDRLDGIPDDVRAFAGVRSQVVRADVRSASSVVVDAIAAFAKEHSGITFEMTQEAPPGRWDVRVDTVLPDASRTAGERLAERALFGEAIGVAVPRESPYEDGIPLSVLAGERFICLAGSRRFRSLCDALCASRGFAPAIAFDSDSPAVVKKMIALGLGVGFWPERSWGALAGSGARWVRLAEAGFERTLAVMLAERAGSEGAAAVFYRFLADDMARIWRASDLCDNAGMTMDGGRYGA